MKALVGAFNQEKALVGAFSVIVQPVVEPMDSFTALIFSLQTAPGLVGGAAAAAGHALARLLALAGGELRSCAGPDL